MTVSTACSDIVTVIINCCFQWYYSCIWRSMLLVFNTSGSDAASLITMNFYHYEFREVQLFYLLVTGVRD
eukprot:c1389_g1_i1 orf=216-425(+)